MTEPKDPARLLEPGSEASDELRHLFENAQRDLPSTADLARLEAKLGPLLDAPPAPPAPPAPAGAPLAKIGLGLLGGGILAAGLWFATRPGEPAPAAPPAKPGASLVAPAVPSAPAPPSTVNQPPSSAADPTPPIPEASAPTTPAPVQAKRAPTIPEDQLLEQARSALRSNPERALSLTRQHQLDFPRGVLSQEREVIAIEALRRLGRTEEAARRTERFERLYPQSAHKRKLDAPQREP